MNSSEIHLMAKYHGTVQISQAGGYGLFAEMFRLRQAGSEPGSFISGLLLPSDDTFLSLSEAFIRIEKIIEGLNFKEEFVSKDELEKLIKRTKIAYKYEGKELFVHWESLVKLIEKYYDDKN